MAVPFSKPDVKLPVDIIEEIMRIDGYDNVEIPSAITISPAAEVNEFESSLKEKVAGYLTGLGFSEILTNSITNSAYYSGESLLSSVRLLNNLTTELNIMRPSLLETGLERIAYNLNHKKNNLLLFEFGRSYSSSGIGSYDEEDHLCLYISGNKNDTGWRAKPAEADIYFLKGVCEKLFRLAAIPDITFEVEGHAITAHSTKDLLAKIEIVPHKKLQDFSVRQPVFFADIYWGKFITAAKKIKTEFSELSKYPEVHRDIAIVINKDIPYEKVENVVTSLNIRKLREIRLFDIFESEKLGADKRSYAISFNFSDTEKTLTDKEIDAMMNKIISSYQKELNAEIRK